MSDKRYEANIIRTTAVEPSNNLQSTSAPGVWSLDEVMELQKKNKWPTVGNTTTDIDDVFSTYVYDGTGSAQTITNGIDLSGEGGLVWFKQRDATRDHGLFDTARGTGKYLVANDTAVEATTSTMLSAFNSNGFTLGGGGAIVNNNTNEYVSWTFRKAPKFFDVVTYTGDGSTTKTVSHNLDSTPAMILFKRTDASGNWVVYHANTPTSDGGGGNYTQPYLRLNGDFPTTSLGDYGNNLTPTSTVIRTPIHTNSGNTADSVNVNGATYVAYLFAHNNNDGGFGPDQDADIIKVGSYTGAYPSDVTVDLGFEPQFIFVKNATASSNWGLFDVMRGMPLGDCNTLVADTSGAENGVLGSGEAFEATPTGFIVNSGLTAVNNAGATHIYMAIRRGPLAQPTAGTQVFAVDQQNTSDPRFTSGFPVDFALMKNTAGTQDWRTTTRLNSGKYIKTSDTGTSEVSDSGGALFDFMDGHYNSNLGTNWYSWMWKRAPGYFDVVAYSGTGSARTVSHNLGVVPEMIWVKARNATQKWAVYHSAMGNANFMRLNDTSAEIASSTRWNDTSPTASVFTVGTDSQVNNSSYNYIAYLFATVAGVSKLGSFVADGSAQDIDCGFSSGARFVLIKKITTSFDWRIWDSVRGIIEGNSPYVDLNATAAESTSGDWVDPYSSGFSITSAFSNGTYLFYAIA